MRNTYTPELISKNPEMIFQIPLYQRLFEWDNEQIEQLLNDLLTSWRKDCSKPYYIGMLTSKISEATELVDGQQRFTVMMLLGIYFGWETFINPVDGNGGKQIRLQFHAREEDKEYLKNKIENTLFYAGDMKDLLTQEFINQHGRPDVIITDPPRAGMHDDVINTILFAEPERIVYVSCNPATQARDLSLLNVKYAVKKVQPVDMFPHTHHVENVVLLQKR